jgi:VanZ family protein
MLTLKNPRIFVPAAIAYAVLILYLSISSNIGNIRHLVNVTLIRGIRDILIAFNLPSILSFLVDALKYAEEQSIDIGHVGIYFAFGILLYFAFVSSKKLILENHSAAFAVFVGTAYGILNEIFQKCLPYRTASVADALSNLLGLVLAQFLLILFIFLLRHAQNWKKRTEKPIT